MADQREIQYHSGEPLLEVTGTATSRSVAVPRLSVGPVLQVYIEDTATVVLEASTTGKHWFPLATYSGTGSAVNEAITVGDAWSLVRSRCSAHTAGEVFVGYSW